MNKTLKNSLLAISKGLSTFFGNIGRSSFSLFRMLVASSISVAVKSKKYSAYKDNQNCCVLGNGPSLMDDFQNGRVLCEGNDILCVNMFCSSPLFFELKPRFYYIVDGAYFAPQTERHKSHIRELIEAFKRVDWDMFLVISTLSVGGGDLLRSLSGNNNIKIIRWNSVEVNGFRWFRHLYYRHRMGMPRCQTVVNFALCTAINMGYKNIYLYGADHTWTRDLFVDKDNVVCYGDRHVYKKELQVIKKSGNFASLLMAFANMFKSHYLLEEYSKSRGVSIWNCSSDSFLDAYKRLQ